ncbi:MAG: hypothetical protein AMXMBFR75_04960 [Candidatus Hinthialibacteria bacterium]|nr:MAG: Type II secretion system protein G precursor [Candidatus Hinthialibacteria bacterium OLB16]MBV6480580.1 hypothetical protein [bacterium]MCK6496134.1 prepilin-type N-terminal cleavage/methylation domain-containing protein [bacterium]
MNLRKYYRRFDRKGGFTLIELLIVIAIILILIAIAMPNFLEAQIRAKVVRVRGDLRTVDLAMNMYLQDFKIYPPDHDPDDRNQQGLYQLSSPIKYLSIVPYDVFNQPNSGIAGGEPFFEMASTGYSRFVAAQRKPKVHAFAVYSHGPDGRDNFSGNDSWPYGEALPCPGGMGVVQYNPTNGSSSVGDIVQLGGEYRSGSYCLDGWQHIRGYYPPPRFR